MSDKGKYPLKDPKGQIVVFQLLILSENWITVKKPKRNSIYKEMLQILSLEKLEPINVGHFYLINDYKKYYSIIEIVVDSFSQWSTTCVSTTADVV